MATQKRTVPVTKEVEFTVCDECEREIGLLDSVARFRAAYRFEDVIFCSFGCLATWAAREAEKHEQAAQEAS